VRRKRQARDAPWSCGNQLAHHSMINRRSVTALHRACLHLIHEPEQRKPDGILHPKPLKTDMTDGLGGNVGRSARSKEAAVFANR
jgi:hypothetical protein